jgi:hypothetical protein
MSNRFPDFDVRRTGKKMLLFASSECTKAASDLICERLVSTSHAPKLAGETGQALWMKVRTIVLELVSRGEIVRVGLTWDIP